MSRTVRRTLSFDAMEGRVLLSGPGHPAVSAHHPAVVQVQRSRAVSPHVQIFGAVVGIPLGSASQKGIVVSSFPLNGQLQGMGRVAGSLLLTDRVIAPGRQPDLSNATIDLFGRRGALQLRMAAAPGNRYIFVVAAGSGAYASAYGSGTAVISYNQQLHEYEVALRSSVH